MEPVWGAAVKILVPSYSLQSVCCVYPQAHRGVDRESRAKVSTWLSLQLSLSTPTAQWLCRQCFLEASGGYPPWAAQDPLTGNTGSSLGGVGLISSLDTRRQGPQGSFCLLGWGLQFPHPHSPRFSLHINPTLPPTPHSSRVGKPHREGGGQRQQGKEGVPFSWVWASVVTSRLRS